ncbi:MAG: hypothetical protein M0P97_00655 [Candidatus Moranbacteria bacterium]|jgi:hypothetical protein|nr:hypothetical protein [Candidatus Moranbacteria bacterium]
MFGNNNNNNNNKQDTDEERKTGVFFTEQGVKNNSEYNFSVHTMKDDLVEKLNEVGLPKEEIINTEDIATQIKEPEREIVKENINMDNANNVYGADNVENAEKKYSSSPFLEKPVAPRADMLQNVRNNSLSDTKQREIAPRENFLTLEKKENSGMVPPFQKENILQKNDWDSEKKGKIEAVVDLKEDYIHPIERHLNWKKVGAIIVLVIVLAAVAGGIYYFFITRGVVDSQLLGKDFSSKNSALSNADSEENFVYSSKKPNYLNLDMETASKSSISQLLTKAFSDIAPEQDGKSVEFIMSDANNNPIAFSRFAYVFNLSLPQAVLDEMEESFSIFLQKTGDNQRIGLAVNVKDANVAPFVIKENEGGLIIGLKPLFLGRGSSNMEKLAFKDSSYGDSFKVRYVDINSAIGDSIDYGIWNNQFLVGTSRDSLRSIFDKVNAEKVDNQIIDMNDINNVTVSEEVDGIVE